MDVKCMFHVYEQWSLVHGRDGIALSTSKVVVVVAIPLSLLGFVFWVCFSLVSSPPQTGGEFSINYVCVHPRSYLV